MADRFKNFDLNHQLIISKSHGSSISERMALFLSNSNEELVEYIAMHIYGHMGSRPTIAIANIRDEMPTLKKLALAIAIVIVEELMSIKIDIYIYIYRCIRTYIRSCIYIYICTHYN